MISRAKAFPLCSVVGELVHYQSGTNELQDQGGNTPLHLACMNGHFEVARKYASIDTIFSQEILTSIFSQESDYKTAPLFKPVNQVVTDHKSLHGYHAKMPPNWVQHEDKGWLL